MFPLASRVAFWDTCIWCTQEHPIYLTSVTKLTKMNVYWKRKTKRLMKVFHYVMLKKKKRIAFCNLTVTDHVIIRLFSQGVCYYIIPIYTYLDSPRWLQIHVHRFNFFKRNQKFSWDVLNCLISKCIRMRLSNNIR